MDHYTNYPILRQHVESNASSVNCHLTQSKEERVPCTDESWEESRYEWKSVEDLLHWASCLKRKIAIHSQELPYRLEFINKLCERLEGILILIAKKRRSAGLLDIEASKREQLRKIELLNQRMLSLETDSDEYPADQDPLFLTKQPCLSTQKSITTSSSSVIGKRKENPCIEDVRKEMQTDRQSRGNNVNSFLLNTIQNRNNDDEVEEIEVEDIQKLTKQQKVKHNK